jgi:outer membrane biosynthesis protein TonB
MLQPKAGYGGRDIDVAVRGVIQTDGSVAEALVDNADRPELASEALALVKQWKFSPALCDGRVNQEVATFIVHFHGR